MNTGELGRSEEEDRSSLGSLRSSVTIFSTQGAGMVFAMM
jgi:hypothetical protein